MHKNINNLFFFFLGKSSRITRKEKHKIWNRIVTAEPNDGETGSICRDNLNINRICDKPSSGTEESTIQTLNQLPCLQNDIFPYY